MITTAGALTVPLVHLHRWLDRMNVPPAPEDAGDGLWYRLGYLERAAQAPEGDEERILTDVVRHLSEACGGVELADADPISQFSALLSRVQQLSQGASPAAYEDARASWDGLPTAQTTEWHPGASKPAEGAEVEVELAQGTHRGVARLVRGPDGVEHLAVVSQQDVAVFWPAVQRWRFAG